MSGETSRSARRIAAMAVLACMAVSAAQLLLIGRIELTFDEAYYTLWSRDLAWGYLDHPPLIAFWIRASTLVFGGSEFGVRALGVLVFALMPALVAFIAWRLYDSAAIAATAALLWTSMPLVAGAPLATPDAPLVAFWTLGLSALAEVWRGRGRAWAGVGAALGFALLAKFTAAFFGIGVGLALLATPSLRRWLGTPGPYLAAALAVLVFAPFLVWSAGHDWETFAKQFGRVAAQSFAPRYLGEFLASQVALANPLLWLALAAAVWGQASPPPAHGNEARRLLVATILPAFLYFLLHSLHDRVQGNWPAPLYPALAILAAEAAVRGPALARGAARWAPALGLGAIALAYLHAAWPWPPFGATDPLARIAGWRDVAHEVDARARDQGAAYVLARGYASTSLLTYYGDPGLPVVQREERRRWQFLPAPDPSLFSRPGIAVGESEAGYGAELAAHFHEVREIGQIERRFSGAVVGVYTIFRVSDPIGDPLDPR